jgi:methylthioribose-1-phosphate isomerase
VRDGALEVLDQRLLPHEESWIPAESPEAMAEIIHRLSVRGAPLIGVAAALSLARFAEQGADVEALENAAHLLRSSRPTAVNLMWAVDRVVLDVPQDQRTPEAIVAEAEAIFEEDVALCDRIGTLGAELLPDEGGVLTHCNAGALATAGIGTAIGVIHRAWESGKKIHVIVDETRPLLQGARLTTWELERLGIPYSLICDNMAAMMFQQDRIQAVVTGADRIAVNGDSANKIGTYGVAVLAHHHNVPMFIAAPYSTIDREAETGADIPIEERAPEEVHGARMKDVYWAPEDAPVCNPAFDVTPVELIDAIITDRGVIRGAELQSNGVRSVL